MLEASNIEINADTLDSGVSWRESLRFLREDVMKDEALIPFGNKACGSKYYGGDPWDWEEGVLLILAVEVRNDGVTERREERGFLLGGS